MLESLERCQLASVQNLYSTDQLASSAWEKASNPPPPPRGIHALLRSPERGFFQHWAQLGVQCSSLWSSPLRLASATPRGAQQLQPSCLRASSGSGRTPQAALGRQSSRAFGGDGPHAWLSAYRCQRSDLACLGGGGALQRMLYLGLEGALIGLRARTLQRNPRDQGPGQG